LAVLPAAAAAVVADVIDAIVVGLAVVVPDEVTDLCEE
jgi:hypothetical protein